MKAIKLFFISVFCLPALVYAQSLSGEFVNVCPDQEYTYTVSLSGTCFSYQSISCTGCYDVSRPTGNSSIKLKWATGHSLGVSATVMCGMYDDMGNSQTPTETVVSSGVFLSPGENPFFICADETVTTRLASDKPIPESDRRCSDTNIRITLSRDSDYPDFLNKGYPFDRSKTSNNTGIEVIKEVTPSGVRPRINLYWKAGWVGNIKVSIEYEKRNWDITDIFGKCETDPWRELVSYTYHKGTDPEGSLAGPETFILSGSEVTFTTSYSSSYIGFVKGIRYSINGTMVQEKTACNGDKTKLGLSYTTGESGIYNLTTEVLDECGRWSQGPTKTINVHPSCYQDNPANVSSSISGAGITLYPGEGYQITHETPYTISVAGITDFAKNYDIDYGSGANDISVNVNVFSISKKLGKYDISFPKKPGRESCPSIPPLVIFLNGKDQTFNKDCEFILPDHFAEFGFPNIDYGNIILEHFAGIVVSKRAVTVKPGVTLSLGAEIILIQPPQPPPLTDADLQRNFIQTTSYDEYNRIIAQNRNYFDDQGKNIQTQSKNIASGVMLATETLFDAYNRPAIKSLPAPVGAVEMVQDDCDGKPVVKQDLVFRYNPSFVKDIHGGEYDHIKFDRSSDTETKEANPEPVGNSEPGTLGWYYSSNNGSATGDKKLINEPLVATTQFPYVRTLFDDDGSGDVLSVANAGDQLKAGSGHYAVSFSAPVDENDQILTDYLNFREVELQLQKPSQFSGNFSKTILTDANGDKSIVYNDRVGNTVISLFYGKAIAPVTKNYQIYDDAGRLLVIVSPNGIAQYNGSNYNQIDKTTHEYNNKGFLVKTAEPDAGVTNFVYRRDGKMRFSQNSEQEQTGSFNYVHYDRIGRPIETGEYVPGGMIFNSTEMQNILENKSQGGGLTGNATNFNNRSFNFYDLRAELLEAMGGPSPAVLNSTGKQQRFLSGRLACTVKENTNTTWYSYDELGRLEWVVQDIVGFGVKTLDYRYGANGNIQDVVYQMTKTDQFTHHYVYDASGRLFQAFTTTQNLDYDKTGELANPSVLELQATYFYYLHGPIKRIEYADEIQGLDFVYTVNGMLKSINDATLTNDPGEDGNDVFGMTLNYFNGDYTNSTYSPIIADHPEGVVDQFNGNIKSSLWHDPIEGNRTFAYAYKYDNRSQLQAGLWAKYNGSNLEFSGVKPYQELISNYDLNGNIGNLHRNNSLGLDIANFQYNYKPFANQLQSITKVNSPSEYIRKYDYNRVGQVTVQEDVASGTTFKPVYDHTGKVHLVKDENDALLLRYDYNEHGFRIKKTGYSNGSIKNVTWYVRDINGSIVSAYEDDLTNSKGLQQTDIPVYASGRIGVYKPQYDLTFYELTDHLGNVRAVIGDKVTAEFLATMETERVADETEFIGVQSGPSPTYINHTPTQVMVDGKTSVIADPNEVIRINNGCAGCTPKPIGGGMFRPVYPGDKITAEVFVKYSNFDKTNKNFVTGLAAQLATSFGPSTILLTDGRTIFDVAQQSSLGLLPPASEISGEVPAAFLNYQLFDRNYQHLGRDEAPVSGLAEIPTDVTLAQQHTHERLTLEVTIEKEGYIYVYVSNVSDQNVEVYFDDLRITHEYSNIVAGNDYYPFGLEIEDRRITREYYRFGFQGKFSEKDSVTGWNHFHLREYDPVIGRWTVPDPVKQYFSRYLAFGNNPVRNVDPTGGEDGDPPGLVTRLLDMVKSWFSDVFSPATGDPDFSETQDLRKKPEVARRIESKSRKIETTTYVAQVEVSPYVSVNLGRQSSELPGPWGVNGGLMLTKYGLYGTVGADATFTPFDGGVPSGSISIGFLASRNLRSNIPGLGLGATAGGSFFGAEYQRDFSLSTYSFEQSHQFGWVLSTSKAWAGVSAQYTFPIYTTGGWFEE